MARIKTLAGDLRVTVHLALCLTALMAALTACEPTDDPKTPYGDTGCTFCHLDKELLKLVADEIETVESSGEG